MFKNFRKKLSDSLYQKGQCYYYAAMGVQQWSDSVEKHIADSAYNTSFNKFYDYNELANLSYKRN